MILSNLCDWCAQSSFEIQDFVARGIATRVCQLTGGSDAPGAASCELRDSPLGEDARGNLYWLFPDASNRQCSRVYRQHAPEPDSGSVTMTLEAKTVDELVALAHADADGADPLLGKLCNVLKTELIPAELARIEAEERKAQRLKRQGLALGLDLSYSNIVDGRRSTTRPVRYTFEGTVFITPTWNGSDQGTSRFGRRGCW